MDGTGFPDPLHSKVIGPPLRACNWPEVGIARTLGGTEKYELLKMTLTMKQVFFCFIEL